MPQENVACSFCGTPRNELPSGLITSNKSSTLLCETCANLASATFAKRRIKAERSDVTLGKPRDIKAFLDQHIIAQERVKRDVAVAVYNHFKRRDASLTKKAGDVEIQKSNILLLGPTGTGKTETFRAISRMLRVPFYIQDCTRLTQQGYVGDDSDDMLRGIMQAAGSDVSKAEWGIILLDEFDKLARKSGRGASGYRDVSGEGVQQGLLKVLEGSKMPITRGMGKNASVNFVGPDGTVRSNVDVIDTTNILFVCAGSFAGIEEVVERRINRGSRLGFGTEDSKRRRLSMTEVYEQVTQDDVLDFGLIPEILGRLPILTSTYELSDTDMVRVLTEPKNSIVKQFEALYAMDDIELQFDQEALIEIGRRAKDMPMGARALRTVVEKVLEPYSFDAPSDPDIVGIRITADVVKNQAPATILRGERREPPMAFA